MVMLSAQNETDYFASSEGSQVVTPHLQARVVMVAATRAEDGMDLYRAQTFEAETVEGLPVQAELETAVRELGRTQVPTYGTAEGMRFQHSEIFRETGFDGRGWIRWARLDSMGPSF